MGEGQREVSQRLVAALVRAHGLVGMHVQGLLQRWLAMTKRMVRGLPSRLGWSPAVKKLTARLAKRGHGLERSKAAPMGRDEAYETKFQDQRVTEFRICWRMPKYGRMKRTTVEKGQSGRQCWDLPILERIEKVAWRRKPRVRVEVSQRKGRATGSSRLYGGVGELGASQVC